MRRAMTTLLKITLPDGSWRQQTFTSTVHPYFIATSRDELGRITTYTRTTNGIVTRSTAKAGGASSYGEGVTAGDT